MSEKQTPLQQNSRLVYDQGLDYMKCLQAILIAKRSKKKESEIRQKFPLFSEKFSEMVSILYKKRIDLQDVLKTKQPVFDNNQTFAQCVYSLLKETAEFDAKTKRADDVGMSDWTYWYEKKMRAWPIFYENFKVLMRMICEGRLQTDPTGSVLVASIDMQMRGKLSKQERSNIFDNFIARKGVYSSQIQSLKITQEEWFGHVNDFFENIHQKTQ